jgi:PR domain zinc finger protein 1
MKEEEFDQHVVFIVPDVATEPGCKNKAEASLPRNLALKPSQALTDVSCQLGLSRSVSKSSVVSR